MTLYADLLNNLPKFNLEGHIGAFIWQLYSWINLISCDCISGFYCINITPANSQQYFTQPSIQITFPKKGSNRRREGGGRTNSSSPGNPIFIRWSGETWESLRRRRKTLPRTWRNSWLLGGDSMTLLLLMFSEALICESQTYLYLMLSSESCFPTNLVVHVDISC